LKSSYDRTGIRSHPTNISGTRFIPTGHLAQYLNWRINKVAMSNSFRVTNKKSQTRHKTRLAPVERISAFVSGSADKKKRFWPATLALLLDRYFKMSFNQTNAFWWILEL